MKVVVAPDSFKECMSAIRVAETMTQALREMCPEAEVVPLPLADGGEGTLDVLIRAYQATVFTVNVSDPLGRPVPARFGVAGDVALVEVAQACGMQRLAPGERRPLTASSRGVGELLLAARDKGCRHFLIGLGGTATCDGGAGMLTVPGIKDLLRESSVELLCDVDAPLLGPQGAARMFAPQKGASPADVEELERRMERLSDEWFRETGAQVAEMPGAGAAGGLGAAFMAFSDARYSCGAERILDLVGFDRAIEGASIIITGEGKSDAQTLLGKVPYTVLRHAGHTPVALFSGRIEDRNLLEQAGFHPIVEITPRTLALPEALQPEMAASLMKTAIQMFLDPHATH